MQKQVGSFLPKTPSRSNGVVADKEESFPLACTICFSTTVRAGFTRLGVLLFDEATHELILFQKEIEYVAETKSKSNEMLAFQALIILTVKVKEMGYKQEIGNSVDLHNKYGKPWKLTDKDNDIMDFCIKAMDIQKSFESFTIRLVHEDHNAYACENAKAAAILDANACVQVTLLPKPEWHGS
ncbi:hypothetical protein MTR_6g007853 [Medicago truncatula]|uniref:Uncharacterized protein n=1 Tax=Medicago truncatula TaxID=3880 RepID=A0A072U734_MEDTR|nr:hypothetical protein MTR_6g007853 [Medicago truncatula]